MSSVTPVTVAYGDGIGPEIVGTKEFAGLELSMIDNRGVCTDSYRCRLTSKNGTSAKETVALLNRVLDQDGKLGFTLAQGQ
jgi:hypothetical protein